jgi:hypothetical protein
LQCKDLMVTEYVTVCGAANMCAVAANHLNDS